MNNFVEFCVRNEIRFDISNLINSKEIVINLYKYDCKAGKCVKLTELRDEGLDLDDICLDFAKNFNDFCEKVGE